MPVTVANKTEPLSSVKSRRTGRKKGNWFIYLLLTGGLIVSVYPFYWLFIAATLNDSQIFQLPPHFMPSSNFLANISGLEEKGPLWTTFGNSLFVAATFTALTVYISALTGYAFAKFQFKHKEGLFFLILITMMLPQQVIMIPLFKMITAIGWQNELKAVIIPALANSFGVFFMRQNMMNVPNELLEAARIDGCRELGIFHRIVLPTIYPSMAALAILSFIQQWGNFMWPLIILQDQSQMTLPLFLSMLVQPGQVIQYGEILAGAAIGVLPVLFIFLFFQKYFISGVYGGAVKG
ncbi:MAG: transporter permease [Firmicutes bacterium]|nr:transporter permease [Bacillota bacterium]